MSSNTLISIVQNILSDDKFIDLSISESAVMKSDSNISI